MTKIWKILTHRVKNPQKIDISEQFWDSYPLVNLCHMLYYMAVKVQIIPYNLEF